MRAHFRGWWVGLGAIATVVIAAIAAAGASSPAFATIGACTTTSSVSGALTTITIAYDGLTNVLGADCQWTVPDGVTSATFTAYGAQGGSAYNPGPNLDAAGGKGGEAVGTFDVTPGTNWTVGVGGHGTDYTLTSGTAGAGGFGGGGSSSDGTGGGGATLVTDPSGNLAVVAGGGGGANFGAPGGRGGGTDGSDGCPVFTQCSTTNSGQGGSATGGGPGESANPGDCSYTPGGNGTGPAAGTAAGSGGAGGHCDEGVTSAGPGGGGGYYGGGGGVLAGGGGGSGFVAASATSSDLGETGLQTGNGVVTISYTVNNTTTVISSDNPNGVDLSSGDVTATYTATVTTTTGNNAVTVGAVTFTDVGSSHVLCSAVAVNSSGQATCAVTYSMSATDAWLAPGHHTIEADYSDSTNTYVGSTKTYDAPVGEPPSYSPDTHTINVTVGVPMTTYKIPAPTCSPSCGLSVSTPAISGLTGTQNNDNTFSVSGTPGSGTYGNHTWTITAGNDLAPDATFTLTIDVQLEGTSTSLSYSGTPTYGMPQTLTATVTANDANETLPPAGTIYFKNFIYQLCSGALTPVSPATTPPSATVTCDLTTRAAGSYNFQAELQPSADFQSVNASNVIPKTIAPADTSTSVVLTTPSSGTPVYGQPVTFTATVTPTDAGTTLTSADINEGTVTFNDTTTNTPLCSGQSVSAGQATCVLSTASELAALTAGTHQIEVSYSDSGGNYSASDNSASELSQQIGVAATTTSLALTSPASGNPVYGQPVTFTATVSANNPSVATVNEGTVTLKYGGGQSVAGCSNLPVNDGSATCTLTGGSIELGAFAGGSIGAFYSDGATPQNFNPSDSSSTALNVQVDPAPTQTALSSSVNPSVYGTGTGTTRVCVLCQQSSVYDGALAFTATVTLPAGSPSSVPPSDRGTVTFTDMTTNMVLCSDVPLSGGSATCTLTQGQVAAMHVGTYTIEANYTDSADPIAVVYGDSSNTLEQVVDADPTTTTVGTSVFENGGALVVSLQASVQSNPPARFDPGNHGTVTFSDSQGALCTEPLVNNAAECTTTAIVPGGGQIVVAYSGSADFAPSSTTTDAGPAAGPVITSITIVDDPSLLIQGAGFTGTSSVTVCGVAVPFTTISSYDLLVGMPSQSGPCTVTVTTPNGSASTQVTLPPMPVAGGATNVGPGGSTPASCKDDTLTLSGAWTLVAWPGAAMDPAQALEASADGCTTDIRAKVSVIWTFDAATQTWEAFFPGVTAPGANDLTQLQQGMGYFVGLVHGNQPVSWSVEVGG